MKKPHQLYSEIPDEQRSQYRITSDELGYGTPREKFRANIAAIQVLKLCETENRLATQEEQEILAGYVGWGSLSDAFDEERIKEHVPDSYKNLCFLGICYFRSWHRS